MVKDWFYFDQIYLRIMPTHFFENIASLYKLTTENYRSADTPPQANKQTNKNLKCYVLILT